MVDQIFQNGVKVLYHSKKEFLMGQKVILIKSMKISTANRDKRVVDEIKGVKPFAISSRTISFYSKIAAVAACFCLIFSSPCG